MTLVTGLPTTQPRCYGIGVLSEWTHGTPYWSECPFWRQMCQFSPRTATGDNLAPLPASGISKRWSRKYLVCGVEGTSESR